MFNFNVCCRRFSSSKASKNKTRPGYVVLKACFPLCAWLAGHWTVQKNTVRWKTRHGNKTCPRSLVFSCFSPGLASGLFGAFSPAERELGVSGILAPPLAKVWFFSLFFAGFSQCPFERSHFPCSFPVSLSFPFCFPFCWFLSRFLAGFCWFLSSFLPFFCSFLKFFSSFLPFFFFLVVFFCCFSKL